MTTRTFKVLGWGAGFTPASITAKLDGETVFSGEVELLDFANHNQTEDVAPVLFTFELPVDYEGYRHMSVTVDDAIVRFGHIVANYTEFENDPEFSSSGAECYLDISVLDDGVLDPRSNVKINGVEQTADRTLGAGTWHWHVMPGSTFEHDFFVPMGLVLE